MNLFSFKRGFTPLEKGRPKAAEAAVRTRAGRFLTGFTVVEILIVVAILGIVSTIVLGSFGGYRSNVVLEGATDQTLALLATARTRTLASRGGSRHGVHLEAGVVTLFSGNQYQAGAAGNEPYTLDPALELVEVSLVGGGSDVLFDRLTGKTSQSGSFVLRLKSNTARLRTISITATGLVSVQ